MSLDQGWPTSSTLILFCEFARTSNHNPPSTVRRSTIDERSTRVASTREEPFANYTNDVGTALNSGINAKIPTIYILIIWPQIEKAQCNNLMWFYVYMRLYLLKSLVCVYKSSVHLTFRLRGFNVFLTSR